MPVLLVLLAVAAFAQGTSEFVLAGLLPGITTDVGVSVGRAGTLSSGFALGMVVGAPAMAAAARRLSPRGALTGFLALFVVAHAVGATTESFAVLLGSRFVAALANAGFLAVTLSTLTRIVPAERHARAVSIVLGGTTLALIVGVPAGALIGETFGWRVTLWSIALVCLPVLAAVSATGPRRPPGRVEPGGSQSLRRELASLRSRPLQLSLAMAALVNAATFSVFTYLAAIATGPAGLTDPAVPALLAVFGVGALLGVSVAGRFADRHWQRLVTLTGPPLLVGWALLAWTVSSPTALWTLTLVQATLSFALGSTLITRIVATARDAPTMGGSFATVALNVGAVVGPLLGGLAAETLGEVGPVLLSAALVLVALVLWGTASVTARRGGAGRGLDD